MPELHRLHDAIYDHGGTETGAKSEEEHFAPLVTPQSLHGSIVDYFDGTFEPFFEIKSGPSRSKIMRFRDRAISEDWSGITDRYCVILPILGQLLHACDHLFRGQLRARRKYSRLFLPGRENLHVGSAYI